MIRRVLVVALLVVAPSAKAACGDRSGPGYRGPNGKCVGWAELGRVCGSPPTTRCTAENVAPGADTAAEHRGRIEQLRQAAPAARNPQK